MKKKKSAPEPFDFSQMTIPDHRPEIEILQDLEKLCTSPGYAHAIAFLCWRENFIGYVGELKPDDLGKMKSWDRLLRSELSVLIGLMVKAPLDMQQPSNKVVQKYIEATEKLLSELHEAMKSEFWGAIKETGFDPQKDNPLSFGKALREPFFYSGEAAYMFQYRDFPAEKYQGDETWFQDNKGFVPSDVGKVIDAGAHIQLRKFENIRDECSPENIAALTLLLAFTFTVDEIVEETGYTAEKVINILKAFSLTSIPCNESFTEIGGFNEANAYPFIPFEGSYILFQGYSFAEAFYETPFFWMIRDKDYAEKAKENRGLFTETFSARRLRAVLGAERVYENVYILDSKGQRAGEIDVLAVFADRAVILQAKSKKLTEAARKGNDDAIQDDFQKAIQHAYDQGFKCAELVGDKAFKLTDEKGNKIDVRGNFAEIFIFCVTSEYYPALAHQADQFLKKHDHEVIASPYVMDVFFLDVLCEILDSPLHFFNFLHRRSNYSNRVMSSNELTVLSYHLAYNLWVQDDVDHFYLDDDISVHVDAAMLVRREGLPGKRTPEGLLTKLQGTTFDDIIKQISSIEHDNLIELGYFLLETSQDACEDFGNACDLITEQTRKDGQIHDFSIGLGSAGITIHSSRLSPKDAYERLYAHCSMRKYSQKTNKWFGLALHPDTKAIQLAMGLNSSWEKEELMEKALEEFPSLPTNNLRQTISQYKSKKNRKIGRNEPCPCGSGKKYKKCCKKN